MPMYSTYEQYWEAHERLLGNVIELGKELESSIVARDGVGRELKEAETVDPPERVRELSDNYARLEGRVEGIHEQFVDARNELSVLEFDSISADTQYADWLSKGIAPDGTRQDDKPGLVDRLASFAAEKLKPAYDIARELTESTGEYLEAAYRAGHQAATAGGLSVLTLAAGTAGVDQHASLQTQLTPVTQAVQQIVQQEAAAPQGLPREWASVPRDQPDIPEAPDPVDEQEAFKDVQDEWDKDEREENARGAEIYGEAMDNARSAPPPAPMEPFAAAPTPTEPTEPALFQDLESGGLGRGPDSFATCEGPDIPDFGPDLELNLSHELPPERPLPPEDPQKGRGR